MIKCIQCQHANMKKYPKHSEVGLALCMLRETLPNGIVVLGSLECDHDCDKFQAAPVDIVEKRVIWRNKYRFNGDAIQ